ncbi:hypothetical protein RRX38_16335 [Pseudomonas sp. DTU_2021_1001937_2_SI_NGA_ILE_001]|uniref:hypothetical protein n=1 Tax=Pseudomonas sp. DTU_2021_1001937_2_SI_NGA_ILE_001 TaxID=3077589 RepID=UPI0025FB5ABE|nr:hypothetical protein [Pseudomonas sp. DTU_2021_1001937_2_SI_NGA_ILE_001]WNW12648.1 hypothetical protein RRX38_16335 [Pseudomonas sp. DTU_2021_1001937_2_SI_NGA_ILE_001]
MANYEVRMLLEGFETSRNPEMLIDFIRNDETTYWARLGSSNADEDFDEVLDSEESDAGFAPEDEVLFGLAAAFMKSLS